MVKITLARNAMATRFEFVLAGDDPVRLRAAGEEALDELEKIEAQLSLFKRGSEIAEINRQAHERPVPLSPPVFALLAECQELSQRTAGAFDITVAPLVKCWGFMKGSGEPPTPEAIEEARARVGMEKLELDPNRMTVRFRVPGMMLDLGSIGKGWALEAAAEVLRDAGITSALLHGGTSTILAIGTGPDGQPWRVAIQNESNDPGQQQNEMGLVHLADSALSVSAIWGKFFELEGKRYGHVIDPRTGWPAQNAVLGAAQLVSATESDALSTAVLLSNEQDLLALAARNPQLRYLQVAVTDSGETIRRQGIEVVQTRSGSG